jgi:hypothetical protein
MLSLNVKRGAAWMVFLAIAIVARISIYADTIEISDNFNEKLGSSGEFLEGSTVGASKLEWRVNGSATKGKDDKDGWVSFSKTTPILAVMPIPKLNNIKTIRIEAKLHPTKGGVDSSWLSIGMGNPSVRPINIGWGEGIMITVNEAGVFNLMYNPSSHDPREQKKIKGGSADKYDSNGYNSVALEYNKQENSVSAWVNDKLVVEKFDLNEVGFTPSVDLAGFSGYSQMEDQKSISDYRLIVSE